MEEVSKQEVDFYKTIIGELKLVIDVGCKNDNIFYELNNNLEIHLFDPMKNPSVILEKIKDKLNIKFNNYGLGREETKIDLYYQYGSMMHRTEEPKFDDLHDTFKVKLRTLKNYCVENNIEKIDYLKIDTEGWDFEVMLGLGDMRYNTKYIQFEKFDYYANNETLKDILRYFKNWNLYEVGGKPLNYLFTLEELTQLKKIEVWKKN